MTKNIPTPANDRETAIWQDGHECGWNDCLTEHERHQATNIPRLIGSALEDTMAEIAACGSWRDRLKSKWLLGKLESCVARNEKLARLREPFTPVGIMRGFGSDLRFYLYDRHRPQQKGR